MSTRLGTAKPGAAACGCAGAFHMRLSVTGDAPGGQKTTGARPQLERRLRYMRADRLPRSPDEADMLVGSLQVTGAARDVRARSSASAPVTERNRPGVLAIPHPGRVAGAGRSASADAAHDPSRTAAFGARGAVGQLAAAAALVANILGGAGCAGFGFVAGIQGGLWSCHHLSFLY